MKKLITTSSLAIVLLATPFLTNEASAWPWGNDDKKAEQTQADQKSAKAAKAEKKSRKVPTVTVAPSIDSSSGPTVLAPSSVPSAPSEAGLPPRVQVKSPLSDELNNLKVEDPIDSMELPPEKMFVAIDDPKNPLGITISADKLNASAQWIAQKKYVEAQKTLNPLKDWLVDATEAHISLHKTLKNIPSAQVQAELEKQLALQFALLRDKAFFQLGMLSIAQQDYGNAVKNLSKVIQSQPRSPMGAQAYEVLQKIGFTEKIQLKEDKKPATALH